MSTPAFKRTRPTHPFFRTTFAARVNEAMDALGCATNFTPSRAEQEAALQPIVTDLLGAPASMSEWWIRATHRGAGTMDALVVQMYKEQRK